MTALKAGLKDSVMFIGFGLGYDLLSLGDVQGLDLIILENRLDLLRASLSVVDFDRIGRKNRLHFIYEIDAQRISSLPLRTGLLRVDNKPLVNADRSGFYAKVLALLAERLKRDVAELNTTGYFSRIWLRNAATNLPRLNDSLSLLNLHGQFSRFPAAVFSSGPTLEQSLKQILPFADQCVLISTSSALRRLQKEHLHPHFVVSTDGGAYASWQLRGLKTDRSILVTDLSVHKDVHRMHTGDRAFFLSGLTYLDHFLGKSGEKIPHFPMQGTVAAAAVMLASYLGCLEVFLFGQDLGFPFGVAHCRGTISHNYRLPRTNRFKTLESWETEEIMASRIESDHDYENRPLLSDFKLKLYKEWFSSIHLRLYQTSSKAAFVPTIPIGKIRDHAPSTGSAREILEKFKTRLSVRFDPAASAEEADRFRSILKDYGDWEKGMENLPESLRKGIRDFASFEIFRFERGLAGSEEVRKKIDEFFLICLKAWKRPGQPNR
jgi:hypothetical protein